MSDESLGRLNRTIDDLEQRMDESTDRVERARSMSEALAGVVGTAQTEDGHVRVTYSGGAVQELEINPRAMRMMAEDLAAAVKKTIADAVVDHQHKTLEALQTAGVVPSLEQQRRDMDAAVAQLGSAQREFTSSLRSAAEIIGRASQAPRPMV